MEMHYQEPPVDAETTQEVVEGRDEVATTEDPQPVEKAAKGPSAEAVREYHTSENDG